METLSSEPVLHIKCSSPNPITNLIVKSDKESIESLALIKTELDDFYKKVMSRPLTIDIHVRA